MEKQGSFYTSKLERLSYGLYFAGQNLLYMIVSAYAALFLINRGLSETLVAGVLLAPKIWDAVNDPIFGVIVDKVRFKKGRFLPWLRISWILIPAATVFLFAMPQSLGQGAKIAWAVIGYMLWDMGYTMCDAPIFALSTSMSPNVKERTTILSFGRLCGTVGAIAAALGIEAVYMNAGWTVTAVALSVLAMLLMFPILITGKERSHAELQGNPSLGEMFKSLIRNKYLFIYYGAYFLIAVTMTVEIIIPIFAQYVLGDTAAGTVLLGICTVPMVVIAAIVPALAKKIDKFWLFVTSIALFAVTSIVQYFTSYENTAVLYTTMAIRSVGYGGYSILVFLFAPDIMEYGHYKTGERQEGICFSLQTFMTKLTAAIVSSLALVLLRWFGFAAANADPVTGVVSAAAGGGCWAVFTWVASIGSLLALPVLLRFYKLRDKDVQLMSRCNNGEITHEECDALLSREAPKWM